MNRASISSILLLITVTSFGCGPSTDGGDDAADPPTTSAGSATSADTSSATDDPSATGATTVAAEGSTTATTPVDCEGLDEDACQGAAACRAVRGPEATPEGDPGHYYCSDLSEFIGCAQADCEPIVPAFMVCKIGDLSQVHWTYEECVPLGWEVCPPEVIPCV